MPENNLKDNLTENNNLKKRPFLISFLSYVGILWLILIFLGIIGILGLIKKNQASFSYLFFETIIFILGILGIKWFFKMNKKGVYTLALISIIDIYLSLSQGIWPLTLNCGCEFPLLATISGLIYFKEMK
jgi:hypothetical protein